MLRAICLLAFCSATLPAGSPVRTVEVLLERAKGDTWEVVDSRTVFRAGEQIRFRFRSSFNGYVYVLDETSSGEFLWLFPDKQSGLNNEATANAWSMVPSTEGSFRIPDKAGFETIYWIVSPTPLKDVEGSGLQTTRSAARTMTPRCEEQTLRARGACLDKNAGPKAFSDSRQVRSGEGEPKLQSRDLSFARSGQATVVKAKAQSEDALIYEFWIAHK